MRSREMTSSDTFVDLTKRLPAGGSCRNGRFARPRRALRPWAATLCLVILMAAAPARGAERGADGAESIGHPDVYFADKDSVSVLQSGGPVSTMRTCGGCHDTEYIAEHSYHASAGLDEWAEPGSTPGGRPWDSSPGLFGRWSPLSYRHLSTNADDRLDLGTTDWIRLIGPRHTGGGPAVSSRTGIPLDRLNGGLPGGAVSTEWAPDTHVLDEETGAPVEWDWGRSGTAELNCFICHISSPANEARNRALKEGRFEWAATAALESTGLVKRDGEGWKWISGAFETGGHVTADRLSIVPPASEQCGACHGIVHKSNDPVIPSFGDLSQYATETKGRIYSAQRLFGSGMNLTGKEGLSRPWDIHAERLMECSDCHFALNDPAYAADADISRPIHLAFDARRLDVGEFLLQPNHNFAKGHSTQGTVADELDGTMRRCENCHDPGSAHNWLPYKKRHMDRLLCESCHIPTVRAPARRATDWTVLTKSGGPRVEYRGVLGSPHDPAALVSGYGPLLLPRMVEGESEAKLSPNNVIASWFWTYGDPPRPVRHYDLERAFFREGRYHPDIVLSLDSDGDGDIGPSELILDTPEKTSAVRERLEALGLTSVRISGEIEPYGLHHGVATGPWATRRCTDCHSHASRISASFTLASSVPGGVVPVPMGSANVLMSGELSLEGGSLVYRPATMADGFYILGRDRRRGIDLAGMVIVAGVLCGVIAHAGLRLYLSRTRRIR